VAPAVRDPAGYASGSRRGREGARGQLHPPADLGSETTTSDELPFKIVRANRQDDLLALALALALNLPIARGAFGAAVGMYPQDLIELRQGARIIQSSAPRP